MDQSKIHSIAAVAAMMIIIPTATILLRCWAVWTIRKRDFGWDDYFAIATLPFIIATAACTLGFTSYVDRNGTSEFHDMVLPLGVSKMVFAIQTMYIFSISFPRFSVLCFYYRIFGKTKKWFQIGLKVVAGMSVAWMIAFSLANLLRCTPFARAIDETIEGTCINVFIVNMAMLSSSILIDSLLFIMPFPLIWRIQAPLAKRISIALIFMCGGIVIVLTTGRLILMSKIEVMIIKQLMLRGGSVTYWVQLEASMSLISVSLPKIFSLIRHARKHGVKSLFSSTSSSSPSSLPSKQASRTSQPVSAQIRSRQTEDEDDYHHAHRASASPVLNTSLNKINTDTVIVEKWMSKTTFSPLATESTSNSECTYCVREVSEDDIESQRGAQGENQIWVRKEYGVHRPEE